MEWVRYIYIYKRIMRACGRMKNYENNNINNNKEACTWSG